MKGQSLVEFAVSIVFIMFLISGAVEFGLAFFQYVQLSDASQEGALYGSACDCEVIEIISRAVESSRTPIDLAENTRVSVEVTATDKFGNPKDPELICEEDALTVRLTYAHHIFMPFLPKLLGANDIILNASTTDTVLYPICE